MVSKRYLVSNLREMLSVLESLRVSRMPGKGMRHLSPRPAIEGGLRVAEAGTVINGKAGEFPVLIAIKPVDGAVNTTEQDRTIPLSAVSSIIFRSAEDRDIAANRSFENASFEGLTLDVDPSLFGGSDEPRFVPAEMVPTEASIGWLTSDWVCGGLAAMLAAARLHPEIRFSSASAFLTEDPGLRLCRALDRASPENGTIDVLVALFSQNSGSGDLYGEELLNKALAALEEGALDKLVLEKFAKWMEGVLSLDISREPAQLTDEKDIVLRALSILIQRPTTSDVLEDRVGNAFPGARVFLTAALLSGVREGLARLPWEIKSNALELIGAVGSRIEEDPTVPHPIASTIEGLSSPSGEPLIEEATQSAERPQAMAAEWRETLRFEICSLSSKAVTGRALTDLANRPANWRIVCDGKDQLYLVVTLGEAESATDSTAEAKDAIHAWKRKASPQKKPKAGKGKGTDQPDMLSGLLGQ